MDDLNSFWKTLRRFLNVMLAYRVQVDPDPLGTVRDLIERRQPVTITNPLGFAEGVVDARDRVDVNRLSADERALFSSAAEYLDGLFLNCGFSPEDPSELRPPIEGDPFLRALNALVAEQIPPREWELREGSAPQFPPAENASALVPIRLTPRQEMILDAVSALAREGPCRAKKICGKVGFDNDSRSRNDLSVLKKFGFLRNDGAGYFRTDKHYQCT